MATINFEFQYADGTVLSEPFTGEMRKRIAVDYVGTVVIEDISKVAAQDEAEAAGMSELTSGTCTTIVVVQTAVGAPLKAGPKDDHADTYVEFPPDPCVVLVGVDDNFVVRIWG